MNFEPPLRGRFVSGDRIQRSMAPPASTPKIEELRFRMKTDPKSRLFYPLAEELRKVGHHTEAEQVLRTGLTYHPSYLSAWVSLGRCSRDQGKSNEAIEALTKALQLDPGNVVAARLLADSYLDAGEKVEAIKKYKLVHALMPSDDDVEAIIERLDRELTPIAPSLVEPEPELNGTHGTDGTYGTHESHESHRSHENSTELEPIAPPHLVTPSVSEGPGWAGGATPEPEPEPAPEPAPAPELHLVTPSMSEGPGWGGGAPPELAAAEPEPESDPHPPPETPSPFVDVLPSSAEEAILTGDDEPMLLAHD